MKRVKIGKVNRSIIALLLALSMVVPTLPVSITAEAAETQTTDTQTTETTVNNSSSVSVDVETEKAKLIAAIDFTSTNENKNGTFVAERDGSTVVNSTTVSLMDAAVCDDALTLEEVKSLDKSFSVVFRMKSDGNATAWTEGIPTNGTRDMAMLSLTLNRKANSGNFNAGLYVGIPGGGYNESTLTEETFYHKLIRQNSSSFFTNGIGATVTTGNAWNASVLLDNNWHTVAIVQDELNITYYVDGQQYHQEVCIPGDSIGSTIFGEVTTDTEFDARIGTYNMNNAPTNYSATCNFDGLMDYYQLYDGALTATEVMQLKWTSGTTTGDAGINDTMPTVELNTDSATEYIELADAELLAAVDFNTNVVGKEGKFNGDTDHTKATSFSLTDTELCDDPLVSADLQSLEKTFSLVFRAKTKGNALRDQAIFSATSNTEIASSHYDAGMYLGIPGGGYNEETGLIKETFYHKVINQSTVPVFQEEIIPGADGNPDTNYFQPALATDKDWNKSSILNGGWHTIAIVQTETHVIYYVDATEYFRKERTATDNIGELVFGDIEATGFDARIGTYDTDQDYGAKCNFKGEMDYFQFYKGTLSEDEILQLKWASGRTSGDEGINDKMPRTKSKTPVTRNYVEMEDAQLLASVDFGTENAVAQKAGTFMEGGTNNAVNLASADQMDDPLTAREVASLEHRFSIVMRAYTKTDENDELFKTGDSYETHRSATGATVLSLAKKEAVNTDYLLIGIPGRNEATEGRYLHGFGNSSVTNSDTNYYSTDVSNVAAETVASESIGSAWHTIAIVQSDTHLIYYVDGKETKRIEANVVNWPTIAETIGSSFEAYIYPNNSTTNFKNKIFRGYMDYYQLYKGALTEEEVKQISGRSSAVSGRLGINGTVPETEPIGYTVEEYSAEEFATYRLEADKDSQGRYTQAPEKAGYVFGGWYKGPEVGEAVAEETVTLAEGETVWAKFIPTHVLQAKYQISSNLIDNDLENDGSGAIRFITTVDTLRYQYIGFKFDFTTEDGKKYKGYERQGSKVYYRVWQTSTQGISTKSDAINARQAFAEDSKYFKAYSFYNIPETDYGMRIGVEPFWETLDGTVVRNKRVVRYINEQRTQDWSYVSTKWAGKEVTVHGQKVTPVSTLQEALTIARDTGGKAVYVLDDVTVGADEVWPFYGNNNHITITSATPEEAYEGVTDTTTVETKHTLTFADTKTIKKWNEPDVTKTETEFSMLSVGGRATFTDIKLDMPEDTHIYANGYRVNFTESVETIHPIQIYGGAHRDWNPGKGSDIEVLGGTFSRIIGGNYGGGLTGNTNVTVGGNVNSTLAFTKNDDIQVMISGGSMNGNVRGNTNVTISGNVNASLDLATMQNYTKAIVCGGCRDGGTVIGNTNVTVEGNAKFSVIAAGGYNTNESQTNVVIGTPNVVVRGNVNAGLDLTAGSAYSALPYAVLYGGSVRGHVVADDGSGNRDTTKPGVTNVLVESTDAGTPKFDYIFGGGKLEPDSTNYLTDTNVTINVEGTEKVCRGLYGGSEESSVTNTSVTMNGGSVLEVFGGSKSYSITGNTDVKLLKGEVTGRIYGGNFNDRVAAVDETTGLPKEPKEFVWDSAYIVGGVASVRIEPELVFSAQDNVDYGSVVDDHGMNAGSRGVNTDEKSIIILNRNTYEDYESKVGSYRHEDIVPFTAFYMGLGDGSLEYNFDSSQVIVTPDHPEVDVTVYGETLTGMLDETYYVLNVEHQKEEIMVNFGYTSTDPWRLIGVPKYTDREGLTLSAAYNCGSTITEYGNYTPDAKMQVVTGMTRQEVSNYANLLEEDGYVKTNVDETSIYPNRFMTFKKDGRTLFLNSVPAEDYVQNDYDATLDGPYKVSLILDMNHSITADEASYTDYTTVNDSPQFYSYGLYRPDYKTDNSMTWGNAGQCQVIRTADNKVIIIDGGAWTNQMGVDGERQKFINFLREITGKSENERIEVSAWVITHFHDDHVGGMTNILKDYGSNFKVERVISNMPDVTAVTGSSDMSETNLRKTYSDVTAVVKNLAVINENFMDVKVHTGDVLQLADVRLRFLYTHEDLVKVDGTSATTDFNDTGCVIAVETVAQLSGAAESEEKYQNNPTMRMLITGDISDKAEAALLANHAGRPNFTFDSDIIQTPHHAYNKLNSLYEHVKPSVVLFTQARETVKNTAKLLETYEDVVAKVKASTNKTITEYFDDVTVGFVYDTESGTVKRFYPEDTYDRADALGSLTTENAASSN